MSTKPLNKAAAKKGASASAGAPALPKHVLALLDQLPLTEPKSGWTQATAQAAVKAIGLNILISPERRRLIDNRYIVVLSRPGAVASLHGILTRLVEAGQEADPILAIRIAARMLKVKDGAHCEERWETGPGLGIRSRISSDLEARLGLTGSPMKRLTDILRWAPEGYELLLTNDGRLDLSVWGSLPKGQDQGGFYPVLFDSNVPFTPDTIDSVIDTLASECAVVMYAAGLTEGESE